jgi:glycosyltransferase involved in cell wall biosynthesis
MKILIVSTSFPLSRADHLSPFIWEFCQGLARRGWQVTVLVPHHPGLPDRDQWDDITIIRFRYFPERFETLGYSGGILPNIKKHSWKLFLLPIYIFAMYRDAFTVAVEEDVDIVNFHWLFPSSFWLPQFVRSTGLPVVLTGHGTDILLATKKIFRFFANRAFRRAAGLTVNSHYMKGVLEQNLQLPPRAEVIGMGVDLAKFRAVIGTPSKSNTILYVGRLLKQKGIDLLVNAYIDIGAQFPDARLIIIGYGPERENISRILQSHVLETKVEMIDRVPHDQLPQYYAAARVLALPSLIPEGQGITPAEAGVCGIPAVTFGLGGTSEMVIDGKTALVVEPKQEALASALRKIFSDGSFADELGRNAREHISNILGWENISARFDSFFGDLVRSHSENRNCAFARRGAFWATIFLAMVTIGYIIKMFADRMERILGLFQ